MDILVKLRFIKRGRSSKKTSKRSRHSKKIEINKGHEWDEPSGEVNEIFLTILFLLIF